MREDLRPEQESLQVFGVKTGGGRGNERGIGAFHQSYVVAEKSRHAVALLKALFARQQGADSGEFGIFFHGFRIVVQRGVFLHKLALKGVVADDVEIFLRQAVLLVEYGALHHALEIIEARPVHNHVVHIGAVAGIDKAGVEIGIRHEHRIFLAALDEVEPRVGIIVDNIKHSLKQLSRLHKGNGVVGCRRSRGTLGGTHLFYNLFPFCPLRKVLHACRKHHVAIEDMGASNEHCHAKDGNCRAERFCRSIFWKSETAFQQPRHGSRQCREEQQPERYEYNERGF